MKTLDVGFGAFLILAAVMGAVALGVQHDQALKKGHESIARDNLGLDTTPDVCPYHLQVADACKAFGK